LTIGGIVQDQAGRPIAQATVTLYVKSKQYGNGNYLYDVGTVTTDANGRWHCDTAPSDASDMISSFSHPDYLGGGATLSGKGIELKKQTYVTILLQGSTIRGRVLDADGGPLRDAWVGYGTEDASAQNDRETKSDAQGQFVLKNCPVWKPAVITVKASGFSPDLQEIAAGEPSRPIEFRLKPPATLRGRIVDELGQPVAGASIGVDTWRGHRFLRFRTNTDKEGRFVWFDAPADEIKFWTGAEFFQSQSVNIKASETEAAITLRRMCIISGKVSDASTGRPIHEFHMQPGDGVPNEDAQMRERWYWRHFFSAPQTTNSADGHYSFRLREDSPSLAMRIESEGYRSAVSPTFKTGGGPVEYDFRLVPVTSLSGVVRTADGTAAAGALVAILAKRAGRVGVVRQEGGYHFYPQVETLKTDAEGRFNYGGKGDPCRVFVLHDAGYALIDDKELAKSALVRLTRWGTIEGTLSTDAEASPGQAVAYFPEGSRSNLPDFYYLGNATTTVFGAKTVGSGHFSLQQVPAGRGELARAVDLATVGPPRPTWTHRTAIEVRPGQTTKVTLQPSGRTIVARIELPAAASRAFDWKQCQLGWLGGRSANRFSYPPYLFAVERDGSFRIEGVLPGDYTLSLQLTQQEKRQNGQFEDGQSSTWGRINRKLTVPEGAAAGAVDIGGIRPDLYVAPGDAAPEVSASDIDGGKPVRLSQFRGKVVLLSFWTPLVHLGGQNLTEWSRIVRRFGSNDRFVLLAVVPTSEAKRVRELGNKKDDVGGIYATADRLAEGEVGNKYGAPFWPTSYVIGPDGVIAAKSNRPEHLQPVIEQMLKNVPRSKNAGR